MTAAPSTTTIQTKPEAQAVAELAERAIKPTIIDVVDPSNRDAKAQILVTGKDVATYSIKEYLDEWRTAPERRSGTSKHEELASLIAWVQRFADNDSALFAQRSPPALVAVIDYHRKSAEGAPRFGEHRASYAFPLSDEWQAWTKPRPPMAQRDFASFIEDRIVDVADPSTAGDSARAMASAIGADYASPSQLLALSRGLVVRADVRVRGQVTLASGETQISYEETHTDACGAPLKVPGAFIIGVPVFRGGDLYQIPVRLRYRVADGKVLWSLELYRTDRCFDDAFKLACELARDQTDCDLFYGTPED